MSLCGTLEGGWCLGGSQDFQVPDKNKKIQHSHFLLPTCTTTANGRFGPRYHFQYLKFLLFINFIVFRLFNYRTGEKIKKVGGQDILYLRLYNACNIDNI